jgi:hypothetical protein
MSAEQRLPGGRYDTALRGVAAENPTGCTSCPNKAAESSRPVTRLTGLLDPQYYLTMKQTYQLLLICAVAFIPDLTSTFGGIESVIVTL